MRWFHYAMVTVVAVLGLSAAQAEPAAPDAGLGGRHLTMTLVAETEHPAAGSNVTLALATVPQPGWHGYWENPGANGARESKINDIEEWTKQYILIEGM